MLDIWIVSSCLLWKSLCKNMVLLFFAHELHFVAWSVDENDSFWFCDDINCLLVIFCGILNKFMNIFWPYWCDLLIQQIKENFLILFQLELKNMYNKVGHKLASGHFQIWKGSSINYDAQCSLLASKINSWSFFKLKYLKFKG